MKTGGLSRANDRTLRAYPVRLVHLGLGSFFRAHQAWYTGRALDASQWGYAAFAGRGGSLAGDLAAQDGLYTLVTRASDEDRFELVTSLSRTHPADDHAAWLQHFRSPALSAVTLTITEAGYFSRPLGGLAADRPEIRADLEALRRDRTARVRTAPARLVAGFAARHQADAGPIALVPCDNMAGNGVIAERVVTDLAELLDPRLAEWITASVGVVTTVVDRITPRPAPGDADAVRSGTGWLDRYPVVTEPFSEWVFAGEFPAGRPSWESAGATITTDVTPYEQRKLWLLNGAHSLLAYAGSMRGHRTVAEAVGDGVCRGWLEEWWAQAAPHLGQDPAEVQAYRSALLERFANPRIHHQLGQIAADGSQKLPIRILPVLRAERTAGRMPEGAIRVLAAWICCLRGLGAATVDVRAAQLSAQAAGALPMAARRILGELDAALGDDADLVAAVAQTCAQLASAAAS